MDLVASNAINAHFHPLSSDAALVVTHFRNIKLSELERKHFACLNPTLSQQLDYEI